MSNIESTKGEIVMYQPDETWGTLRICGKTPPHPHARNARLCRFACKELTRHLKVNTVIAEFDVVEIRHDSA